MNPRLLFFLLLSFSDFNFLVEPYNFRTLTSEAIDAPRAVNQRLSLFEVLTRGEREVSDDVDTLQREKRTLSTEHREQYLNTHNQLRREQMASNMRELVSDANIKTPCCLSLCFIISSCVTSGVV